MADATYRGGVYRAQGGDSLVVASSGTITNEGTFTSTGTVTIQHSTAGYMADSVQDLRSSTAGTLTAFGISLLGTTQAGAFTLPAPAFAGVRKSIFNTNNGATTVTKVVTTASTAVTVVSTSDGLGATLRTITFTDGGEGIDMIAATSAAWAVLFKGAQVVLTS